MTPREFVEHFGIRSLVCCFSGGKDSLASTHYTLQSVEGLLDLDTYVVHVDTTVMLPIAIDYVKEISDRQGWNLRILKPKTSFWEQAEKKGMPWIKRRWCCYGLKLQPIFDFLRTLPHQRGSVTGLRKDESPNRQKKLKRHVTRQTKKGMSFWAYAPLLYWTKNDVIQYIEENDLPMPPHYRLGFKETCMCGAFSSKREIMILKAHFPELFQKFVELEQKFRIEWACFYDHKPVFAKDLAKQMTLDAVIAR